MGGKAHDDEAPQRHHRHRDRPQSPPVDQQGRRSTSSVTDQNERPRTLVHRTTPQTANIDVPDPTRHAPQGSSYSYSTGSYNPTSLFPRHLERRGSDGGTLSSATTGQQERQNRHGPVENTIESGDEEGEGSDWAASRSFKLSDEQEDFITESPFGNLRQWYKFLDKHPSLFKDDNQIPVFVGAAVTALKDGDTKRARSCIEKVSLLALAGGQKAKRQDEIFESIRDRKPPLVDQYTQVFKFYDQKCRTEAGQSLPPVAPRQGTARPTGGPPINIRDPADTGLQPSIKGVSGNAEFESLDARFTRRDPRRAGRFFRVGRVFAILAHSEYSKTADSATDAKWKTPKGDIIIYSHVRHFAVVREGHGYCWAVPINTYGGQGVAKSGLNQRDVHAHAVIYDSHSNPKGFRTEPHMPKKPIAVDRSEDADKLDIASRINFAKVTTVEHNVRAMAVGFVSDASIPNFEEYWKQHLLG